MLNNYISFIEKKILASVNNLNADQKERVRKVFEKMADDAGYADTTLELNINSYIITNLDMLKRALDSKITEYKLDLYYYRCLGQYNLLSKFTEDEFIRLIYTNTVNNKYDYNNNLGDHELWIDFSDTHFGRSEKIIVEEFIDYIQKEIIEKAANSPDINDFKPSSTGAYFHLKNKWIAEYTEIILDIKKGEEPNFYNDQIVHQFFSSIMGNQNYNMSDLIKALDEDQVKKIIDSAKSLNHLPDFITDSRYIKNLETAIKNIETSTKNIAANLSFIQRDNSAASVKMITDAIKRIRWYTITTDALEIYFVYESKNNPYNYDVKALKVPYTSFASGRGVDAEAAGISYYDVVQKIKSLLLQNTAFTTDMIREKFNFLKTNIEDVAIKEILNSFQKLLEDPKIIKIIAENNIELSDYLNKELIMQYLNINYFLKFNFKDVEKQKSLRNIIQILQIICRPEIDISYDPHSFMSIAKIIAEKIYQLTHKDITALSFEEVKAFSVKNKINLDLYDYEEQVALTKKLLTDIEGLSEEQRAEVIRQLGNDKTKNIELPNATKYIDYNFYLEFLTQNFKNYIEKSIDEIKLTNYSANTIYHFVEKMLGYNSYDLTKINSIKDIWDAAKDALFRSEYSKLLFNIFIDKVIYKTSPDEIVLAISNSDGHSKELEEQVFDLIKNVMMFSTADTNVRSEYNRDNWKTKNKEMIQVIFSDLDAKFAGNKQAELIIANFKKVIFKLSQDFNESTDKGQLSAFSEKTLREFIPDLINIIKDFKDINKMKKELSDYLTTYCNKKYLLRFSGSPSNNSMCSAFIFSNNLNYSIYNYSSNSYNEIPEFIGGHIIDLAKHFYLIMLNLYKVSDSAENKFSILSDDTVYSFQYYINNDIEKILKITDPTKLLESLRQVITEINKMALSESTVISEIYNKSQKFDVSSKNVFYKNREKIKEDGLNISIPLNHYDDYLISIVDLRSAELSVAERYKIGSMSLENIDGRILLVPRPGISNFTSAIAALLKNIKISKVEKLQAYNDILQVYHNYCTHHKGIFALTDENPTGSYYQAGNSTNRSEESLFDTTKLRLFDLLHNKNCIIENNDKIKQIKFFEEYINTLAKRLTQKNSKLERFKINEVVKSISHLVDLSVKFNSNETNVDNEIEKFKQMNLTPRITKMIKDLINLASNSSGEVKDYFEKSLDLIDGHSDGVSTALRLFKVAAGYLINYDAIVKYGAYAKELPKDKEVTEIKLGNDNFRFRALDSMDPYHFQVGADTSCCQTINGAGEAAAIDSFVNPKAGVLLLEVKVGHDWVLAAQSYFHIANYKTNKGPNMIVLDNIETTDVTKTINKIYYNGIFDDIYASLAFALKAKGYEYVLCGKAYTTVIKASSFGEAVLESDPRHFEISSKKFKKEFDNMDTYTDFSYKKSIDLLAPKSNFKLIDFGDINLDDITASEIYIPLIKNAKIRDLVYLLTKANIKNWAALIPEII